MVNKYNARKTIVDGITFDSKKEAARYQELKMLERANEIYHLECQKKFSLDVNEMHIANYFCDFYYYDARLDKYTTEDVKGILTPVYRLKKKLMLACHDIEIVEV